MNNNRFLGLVRAERLEVLAADGTANGAYRLTQVLPQSGGAPEAAEIGLARYEGMAVLVRGIAEDGWIYGASVVEAADEILTAVVAHVFMSGASGQPHPFPTTL